VNVSFDSAPTGRSFSGAASRFFATMFAYRSGNLSWDSTREREDFERNF
jgi:hypothetical protein